MPDQGAEMLETLPATVIPLLAMHGDDPAGAALPPAEATLPVSLLAFGEATQLELASRIRVGKSRVSRLCSALERKHLIARERDPANRRNVLMAWSAVLSCPRGRRMLSSARRRIQARR